MEEQEIKDLAKNHFFEGQNEKELAIARIGFVEGYKQAQPKWIDVKDRLPEQKQKVYFFRDNVSEAVYEGSFITYDIPKKHHFHSEGVFYNDVTHWSAKCLPQPPTSAMS